MTADFKRSVSDRHAKMRAGRAAVIGFIALGAVRCSAPAPPVILMPTPPTTVTVPPLQPQKQLIEAISSWDGRNVIVTEAYESLRRAWIRELYVVSEDALVPLVVAGRRPLAVSENATTSFALCAEGPRLLLLAKPKEAAAEWRQEDVGLLDETEKVAHLEAGGDGVFVFTGPTVRIRRANGRWERRTIRSLVGKDWPDVPRATLMTDAFLFVGYDAGEFGGGAYAVPLREGGPKGAARKITNYNVAAFARGSRGEVWIAGGLSHMGIAHGWLKSWRDGLTTTLIDQSAMEGVAREVRGQPMWRLGRPSEISGIAVGPDHRLLVMAARIGVLELGPNGLVPVIPSDFYVHWQEPGYGVGCFPQGIAVGADGQILVAMRSLGVLRYRRELNDYRMTQLQFRTNTVEQ